ncbi:hypothetical protein EON80_31475, partial [bacterium]
MRKIAILLMGLLMQVSMGVADDSPKKPIVKASGRTPIVVLAGEPVRRVDAASFDALELRGIVFPPIPGDKGPINIFQINCYTGQEFLETRFILPMLVPGCEDGCYLATVTGTIRKTDRNIFEPQKVELAERIG